MGQQALYQVSLIAAFIAGMIALFAPCCISYLLPAYFGNIFKEKKRILLMTLVYSLGIFAIMLPIVLGAKALSSFFFRFHDQAYFVGGAFMLIVALMALFGIKLPMPNFTFNGKKGNDFFSTFTLGIIAGITSSCCAPVLVGVLTLSSFAPSLLKSVGVGISYVLGMVAPLYFASLFIEKRNILDKPIMRKQVTSFSWKGKKYPILTTNLIAAGLFFLTGAFTLILASAGMVGMPTGNSPIIQLMQDTALRITEITQGIPGLNLLFAIAVIYFFYRFIKLAGGKKSKKHNCCNEKNSSNEVK